MAANRSEVLRQFSVGRTAALRSRQSRRRGCGRSGWRRITPQRTDGRSVVALLALLAPGCGIIPQASPESLFHDSEQKLRRGELDAALRQTENAVRSYRSQPRSTWYWQFQLLRLRNPAGSRTHGGIARLPAGIVGPGRRPSARAASAFVARPGRCQKAHGRRSRIPQVIRRRRAK